TRKKLPCRPEMFDFEGISMTHFFTENWEKVRNFQSRPDDILIATYPKAGTTWVSYILDLLYFGNKDPECQTSKPIYMRIPFLESCFQEFSTGKRLTVHFTVEVFSGPKIYTRPRIEPNHFLPKPDVYKKNFFFFKKNPTQDRPDEIRPESNPTAFNFEPDWTQTHCFNFSNFSSDVFGPWYDHVSGWWEKKQTYSNLLYLFYEDLVEDTGREVERLCSFLGLSISIEEREKITKGVQFDTMKQNKMINHVTIPFMDFKISPFMRKGKVGDWKGHFTVAQNEQFDEVYKQKMKNTTLKFRTEI
uniref:Sulfotransferase n=1 Tax=Cyprinus carpio TaxID=7962 RepID=A0A8C2BSB2_CYPCA